MVVRRTPRGAGASRPSGADGTRRGPKISSMQKRSQHSFEHRGQSGKYGTIYKGEVPLWSCTAADHEICIIPYKVEGSENSPFRRNDRLNMPFSQEELRDGDTWDYKLSLFVHYNIGVNEDAVVCLRSINEACPICEERERLIREEDMDSSSEEVRAVSASKKCLYNIVVFDNEKETAKGIQVWEAPHKSIEDVLSELANKKDRRTGERESKPYMVPEENLNIAFERSGKGFNTDYKQVEILDRPEELRFTDEELNTLLESAFDFDNTIELKTYEQIYAMLHGVSRAPKAEDTPQENAPVQERSGRFRRQASVPETAAAESTPRESARTSRRAAATATTGNPECFGIDCNRLDACNECPDVTYEACYTETESRKSV